MQYQHVLVLNGSLKYDNSYMDKILSPFKEGLEEAGASVVQYNLCDMELSGCTGCLYCWMHPEGNCIIEDELQVLKNEFLKADILVLASPIHFFSATSLLKTTIERLFHGLASAKNIMFAGGEYYYITRRKITKQRKGLLISTAPFEGKHMVDAMSNSIEKTFSIALDDECNKDFEFLGNVFIPNGEILKYQEVVSKCSVLNENLQMAGKEVVEYCEISKKTINALNKPVYSYVGLSKEEYADYYNKLLKV